MNQYLLIACYDEDEMERHVLKGEEALLDTIEKSYLVSRAALEVYVLDGAVKPITTNVAELLKMAEERQKLKKVTSRHLEALARDMTPKCVIVVPGTATDVAFGSSQVDAIKNFVEIFVRANGGGLSENEALLIRKALKVRDYRGSSYSHEHANEVNGDDSRFDDAFAGLISSTPAPRR